MGLSVSPVRNRKRCCSPGLNASARSRRARPSRPGRDNQIEFAFLQGHQAGDAAIRNLHVVANAFQDFGHQVGDIGLVVDHQDASRPGLHGRQVHRQPEAVPPRLLVTSTVPPCACIMPWQTDGPILVPTPSASVPESACSARTRRLVNTWVSSSRSPATGGKSSARLRSTATPPDRRP